MSGGGSGGCDDDDGGFGGAVLAANKWISDHPNVSLILPDDQEQRMYFLINGGGGGGSSASFDITLQTAGGGDRPHGWIVRSDCDEQKFLEKAKKLCTTNSRLTLEELLNCISSEKQREMPPVEKTCDGDDTEENDDDDYMADNDYPDDDYYNDSEPAVKPSEPAYSEEEFNRFASNGNPSAVKRLLADMKTLNSSNGKFGVSGSPRGDNLFIWDVKLTDFEPKSQLGQDLITYSQKFRREPAVSLEMKFQDTYPMTPPFVRVTRPRFKFLTGHVTIGGSICMQMLTRSGWSPGNDIEGILIQIRSEIMSDPSARLELNRDVEYSEAEAKDAFQRMVAKYKWN